MAVQVGLLVLSVGLSMLAGYLLRPKDPIGTDDKPTTLSTRGSYTPWVLGLRRVGPVFCWAGERTTRKEKAEGGKGAGAAGKVKVFYEQGMHVLCSGHAFALHEITQAGKRIFEGPITRDSHPSGSTISLGNEGSFRIYWGGEDQDGASPDSAYAAATGVSSVFPYFCYVVWDAKRLGPTPAWPMMEYTIECRPEQSELLDSPSRQEPGYVLDGPSATVAAVANGAEGSAYFLVMGARAGDFPPQARVRLTGTALSDRDLTVLRSEGFVSSSSSPSTSFGVWNALDSLATRVYVEGGLSGASAAGTLQVYTEDETDGANLAHCIDEMLFADYPFGAGLSRDDWDADSLEALGTLLESEADAASLMAQNGATIREVLGAALQDVSCMLTFDTGTGKHTFVPLREPAALDASLAEDLLVAPEPEREVFLGEPPVDQLIFSWSDRSLNFREMTVQIGDDGRASPADALRSRRVQIPSTVNYDTGALRAERRSIEEFSAKSVFTIYATRGAKLLNPGDVIFVDGFEDLLRVVGVKPEPLTGKVAVKCIVDSFGVPASDFVPGGPSVNDTTNDPDADLAVTLVELPVIFTGDDSRMQVVVPRIRAGENIVSAGVHFSRSGSTYTFVGDSEFIQTGGTLDDALAADTNTVIDSIDITALGEDIAILPDYSGDDESWRLGRFVAVIGGEILFVQSVTALGGDSYRLNNVLRARYDTSKGSHSAGAGVFLFAYDEIEALEDPLLVPDEVLYVKTAPRAGSTRSLTDVSPIGGTLYGKGLRPMPVANLRCSAPQAGTPIFATGGGLTLKWAYRSFDYRAASPALLPAGAARGAIAFEGSFVVELLTTGDVLQETFNTTSATLALTNGDLVAAFGSEPSSFKVRVSATHNGRTSTPIEITVTRI